MPNRPKVVDLFSGVGGLSLGAARAGFEVVAAVDSDSIAVKQHGINFPASTHLNSNIRKLSGKDLLEACGLKKGELHGVVGGPPCQGFSIIGRRTPKDPRNLLFADFFRIVSETLPAFFVAENVPGILMERNRHTLTNALSLLPKRYKILAPFKIRASDFGAPTTRTRVFIVGYDPDRIEALSTENFRPTVEVGQTTVGPALSGLPALRASWQSERESWRSVDTLDRTPYGLSIQGLPPPGVGDPDSLVKFRRSRLVSGFLGTLHTKETVIRFGDLRPGEIDPISGARRLSRADYCPTLRAGTGPDRGSYQAVRPIHPGSPRVIAPREAARLQGFPDWFVFHPTKWHAFRQIGNSVSPIVSEALLTRVFEATA
jgi:DNA (cytosine-5)-methyltransferase 1